MGSESLSQNKKAEITQVKAIAFINNIKSDYILKKIFTHLQKTKSLEIIKYNKKAQCRLNININDYKEYSEIYSKIEIELIPNKNKNGQFINIKKEEKSFYHIYFNDSKEEVQNYYLNKKDKVSKIKIIIDYQIKSFIDLFKGINYLESISFNKFYRNI